MKHKHVAIDQGVSK